MWSELPAGASYVLWGLLELVAFFFAYVIAHEAGHYAVARAAGLPISSVDVGEGDVLVEYCRGGVWFRLRQFPTGGGVNFAYLGTRRPLVLVAMVLSGPLLPVALLALADLAGVAVSLDYWLVVTFLAVISLSPHNEDTDGSLAAQLLRLWWHRRGVPLVAISVEDPILPDSLYVPEIRSAAERARAARRRRATRTPTATY